MQFNPNVKIPQTLLAQCPEYRETPLLAVDSLCSTTIWIKDESSRMGLGSFKALGGFYAIARLIAKAWAEQQEKPKTEYDFNSDEHRRFAKTLTFVCASAGNHGLSVAAGAKVFGANSRVHLARSVPEEFAIRLRAKGATVVSSGLSYEDSVANAITEANEKGFTLVADGSWPGYTKIPSLVMEGYTVIAAELKVQFMRQGLWPTHVYLQAGVGGLAAAMSIIIRSEWPEQPQIVVVEPEAAPCLRDSHLSGKPTRVSGPTSNMGRLDCKEPSILAFEVLNEMADHFITVSDLQAQETTELLGNFNLSSTPSGVAGLAALLHTSNPNCCLSVAARPLVIISEAAL